MSLVNDMLRELRQSEAVRADAEASPLAGLQPVSGSELHPLLDPQRLTWVGIGVAGLLLALVVWGGFGSFHAWLTQPPSSLPMRLPGPDQPPVAAPPPGFEEAEQEMVEPEAPFEEPEAIDEEAIFGAPPLEVEEVVIPPTRLQKMDAEVFGETTRLRFRMDAGVDHWLTPGVEPTHYEVGIANVRLSESLPPLDLRGTVVDTMVLHEEGGDLTIAFELSTPVRVTSQVVERGTARELVLDLMSVDPQPGTTEAPDAAEAPPLEVSGPPSLPREREFVPEGEDAVPVKTARPLSRPQKADQAYRKGVRRLHQGYVDAAIKHFEKAISLLPEHIDARERLAAALLELKRMEAADQLLADGLVIHPAHAPFAKLRARMLVDVGQSQQAIQTLETAMPPVVEDPAYHAFLAALYQAEGEYDRSISLYNNALSEDPRNASWWMGLGISLEASSNPRDALIAFRAADRLGGIDPEPRRYVQRRIQALSGDSR